MQLDCERDVLDQGEVLEQAAQGHGGRWEGGEQSGWVQVPAFPDHVSALTFQGTQERVHLVAGHRRFAQDRVTVTVHGRHANRAPGSGGLQRYRVELPGRDLHAPR